MHIKWIANRFPFNCMDITRELIKICFFSKYLLHDLITQKCVNDKSRVMSPPLMHQSVVVLVVCYQDGKLDVFYADYGDSAFVDATAVRKLG